MNTDQIYQIVLLVCVLSALVISRKMRTAPSAKVNVNEIIPKTNARLNRVQKVSKCIRLFLRYGIPLIIFAIMALEYLAAAHKITLPELLHPSKADSATPDGVVKSWSILSLVLCLFWYRTVLKLFGSFENGILFTAATVRCIKILGVIYCARSLVLLVLSLFCLAPSLNNHWLGAGLGDLFTGLLIVFVGWLIDEARKIQEEQELTV